MMRAKHFVMLSPRRCDVTVAVLAYALLILGAQLESAPAQTPGSGAVSPVATASVTPAAISARSARYTVTDLGVIQRIAADIVPGLSASGNTVISQQMETQAFNSVFYDGKTRKPLLPPEGYRNSFAYSVNDHGDAVGWSNTTLNPVDSMSTVHATLFGGGRSTDLGTLGGQRSRAYAINNKNVIVGVSELEDHQQRAFRYADGTMVPLAPLPGGKYSAAFDINDAGVIVGGSGIESATSKPIVHAVLWRDGVALDLGTVSGKGNSLAYALNSRGDVVGIADEHSEETVFLYSEGKMRDLGIRGHAFSINDQRQIVGTLAPEERGRPRGFLWENGEVRDINTLIQDDTYRIEIAYRINNRGQILCSGFGQGHMHALLLNPVK